MELKEYVKEMIKKVEKEEEEEGVLAIYLSDDIDFMYHDECFADFHEDFFIAYDKNTNVNMVIPYDKIITMQYMNKEIFKSQLEELKLKRLLSKMMEE